MGAGLPVFLGVPGENLVGVFSANEYLTRVNLGRAYDFPTQDTPAFPGKNVTVFGAGNVAMDAARTALRMGAESGHIVYRRTKAEMPARLEEVEHAEEEGVQFAMLSAPLRFNGNAELHLTSVTLQKMELGEPDASGRRRPVPIAGSEYDMSTDLAIVALGTRSNPILLEATPDLAQTQRGYIQVNEETGEVTKKACPEVAGWEKEGAFNGGTLSMTLDFGVAAAEGGESKTDTSKADSKSDTSSSKSDTSKKDVSSSKADTSKTSAAAATSSKASDDTSKAAETGVVVGGALAVIALAGTAVIVAKRRK